VSHTGTTGESHCGGRPASRPAGWVTASKDSTCIFVIFVRCEEPNVSTEEHACVNVTNCTVSTTVQMALYILPACGVEIFNCVNSELSTDLLRAKILSEYTATLLLC
jgi:hypothetical protein